MTPQQLAIGLEQKNKLPAGGLERFNGFGVLGLPFASGHILAMRRFPASSIGPGYTSVWHRNPSGDWTFFADTEPARSCSRFFGKLVKRTSHEPIKIQWLGSDSFRVTVKSVDLAWEVTAGTTAATAVLNAVGGVLPETVWQNQAFLKIMGKIAGMALGVGKVGLTGSAPNGQEFLANPRQIWVIKESKALMNGEDLGPIGPLPEQAHLADFWIPQKGMLAFGQAYFDIYDPQKHVSVTSMS